MRRKHALASAVLPLFFLVLLVACASPAQDPPDLGQPIQWTDGAVEQAVRQELNKPTGTIYSGELDSLRIVTIRSASIQFNNNAIYPFEAGQGVQQLDDLAYFRKLGGLEVSRTQISDYSVVALCRELQRLYLYDNPNLSDLSFLTGLPKLSQLILYGTGVTDLGPIGTLPELQELDLRKNQLQTLDTEGKFPKLRKLKLEANQISDLSFLSSLVTLQELDLRKNAISDLTPLQNLSNLQKLSLAGNDIEDLSPLAAGSYPHLAMLDLSFNRIEDLSPLSGCGRLSTLNFASNQVEDLTPLEHLSEMRVLSASRNQFTSIEPLGKLSNLLELDLSHNLLADVSSLRKLRRLTTLNLTDCPIPQGDLKTLSKALPQCHIVT
ncbi:MAG: leucine-rich repeat domain-containing protein [Oscillospiraceae bacterium]|jgi:Leucine-rich repeat (LRR) protein